MAPPSVGESRSYQVKQKKWGTMPAGRSKFYEMNPHGFYDAAAEIVEAKDPEKKTLFWRSKTRCSAIAEWLEIGDPETNTPTWRCEARYADRGFYAERMKGEPADPGFLTVLRMYKGHAQVPQLMLVHRCTQPGGIRSNNSSKEIEVYMCKPVPEVGEFESPEAELDAAEEGVDTRPRQRSNLASHVRATAEAGMDEAFFFGDMPLGEDVFTLSTNETFTAISLAAEVTFEPGAKEPAGKRVLAHLKRTVAAEKRIVEVDGALDVSLVMALFAAVDQLMLTHDALDYDVDWPSDYVYAAGNCLTPRRPERNPHTYRKAGENLPEAPAKAGRGCFGLW